MMQAKIETERSEEEVERLIAASRAYELQLGGTT